MINEELPHIYSKLCIKIEEMGGGKVVQKVVSGNFSLRINILKINKLVK